MPEEIFHDDEIHNKAAELRTQLLEFCKKHHVPIICILGKQLVTPNGLELGYSPAYYSNEPEEIFSLMDSFAQYLLTEGLNIIPDEREDE